MQKYKLTQYAAKQIGLHVRYEKESNANRSEGRREYKQKNETRAKIKAFLEREDNSRQLPGKADAVKSGHKRKIQKFVLSDYMHNIFLKFKAENPNEKISFATFCRSRPKHVSLVNYAARITCLCTRHQNFALKLQCLKRYGVTSNTSPDNFSENNSKEDFDVKLDEMKENEVGFKEWKRVKCDDGKQRTKLLDMQKDKTTFIEDTRREFGLFKEHVKRVKTQFQAFKEMNVSLKKNTDHVCVNMDFS